MTTRIDYKTYFGAAVSIIDAVNKSKNPIYELYHKGYAEAIKEVYDEGVIRSILSDIVKIGAANKLLTSVSYEDIESIFEEHDYNGFTEHEIIIGGLPILVTGTCETSIANDSFGDSDVSNGTCYFKTEEIVSFQVKLDAWTDEDVLIQAAFDDTDVKPMLL